MRYCRIFVPFVLVVVPLVVIARPHSPRWDDMHSKHSWSAVPEDWEYSGPPPIGTTLNLHVALKPHREKALIHALYEVSTPGNPKYRAHLSREQVAELVAPHPDTLQLVHSWLEYSGIPSSSISVSDGGDSLMLSGVPVPRANDLLGASYRLYRHVKTNGTIVRTLSYALPVALDGHVRVVVPTTSFDSPQKQLQEPHERFRGAKREDIPVANPGMLAWLYNTYGYPPGAKGRNSLGIASFWQKVSKGDLVRFMHTYRKNAKDAIFREDVFYPDEDPDGEEPKRKPVLGVGAEANMQMEYAQAMVYPTPITSYIIGPVPSGTEDDVLTPWLTYMVNAPDVPQTILIPLGNSETFYSREHAEFVCDELAKLGARGVSILVASGDSGVGRGDCQDGLGKVRFRPSFPGTCPSVTTVGGTTGHSPEVAAYISGGGFSDYFLRPDYQQEGVFSFLQVETLENKYEGKYNESGRGIPDISAQALNFVYYLRRNAIETYGTTVSATIAAGIIALLNDYELSRGNAPLGFLNPWLYGEGLKGINDIQKGLNPGCNEVGFSATEGWDPVTGLGTLDFRGLQFVLYSTQP